MSYTVVDEFSLNEDRKHSGDEVIMIVESSNIPILRTLESEKFLANSISAVLCRESDPQLAFLHEICCFLKPWTVERGSARARAWMARDVNMFHMFLLGAAFRSRQENDATWCVADYDQLREVHSCWKESSTARKTPASCTFYVL